MHTRIHQRRALVEDAHQIASVHAASWRAAYTGVLPTTYLASDLEASLTLRWASFLESCDPGDWRSANVAVDGSVIVGFVNVERSEASLYDALLDNVHVHPTRWRRGVGRLLMVKAAKELYAHELRSLYLWVYELNRQARAFYAAIGGVELDRGTDTVDGAPIPQVRVAWADIAKLARSPMAPASRA